MDSNTSSLKNFAQFNDDCCKPVAHLHFNPVVRNYLAVCYEGGRSVEYSLCVYDLNRTQLLPFRLKTLDRINCSTWFNDDANALVVGCYRSLKLFDVRQGTRQISTISLSHFIRALTSSISCCYQFASLVDGYLYILDRRNLSSVHKIPLPDFKKVEPNNVELWWNPAHHNHLSFLQCNSKTITNVAICFDQESMIKNGKSGVDKIPDNSQLLKGEQTTLEGDFQHLKTVYNVYGLSRVSGINWHPKRKNRLVIVGPEDEANSRSEAIVQVVPFLGISTSPQDSISFSIGNKQKIHELVAKSDIDIASVMHQRALNGYGSSGQLTLGPYIASCKNLIFNCSFACSDIKWLWKWLSIIVNVADWKYDAYGTWFPGVLQIMENDADIEESSDTERFFVSDCFLGTLRIYSSWKRDRILGCCGWPFHGDQSQIDTFIDTNFAKKITEHRAVAVALLFGFFSKMKTLLCAMVENRKASNDVDLAEVENFVEGINQYKGQIDLWLPIAERLKSLVSNGYFKMILTFLSGCCDTYLDISSIMLQEDVMLEDRIAFGAIYLSDQVFIRNMVCISETSLHSKLQRLFITGLSYNVACHDILSEYVDATSDVQTTTILLILGKCLETITSENLHDVPIFDADLRAYIANSAHFTKNHIIRSLAIIYDYREMLNSWGLWLQRGRIDGLLLWQKNIEGKLSMIKNSTSCMEICCPFCRRSVNEGRFTGSATLGSLRSKRDGLKAPSLPQLPSPPNSMTITREISCQNCMRPLPKCVLCHGYMGSSVTSECSKLGRSSSWFSWCQICRHGGHTSHLRHWFRSRNECPAAGCSCKCPIADVNISGCVVDTSPLCDCVDQ